MSDRDQKNKETCRAFRIEAREQPLGVDVSDFGDEFVEGFLNGQENALGFIELVLDGTMATFQQARFVKPWLEALPAAPVEPPVLSREFLDSLIEQTTNRLDPSPNDAATVNTALQNFARAILESLSQEEAT